MRFFVIILLAYCGRVFGGDFALLDEMASEFEVTEMRVWMLPMGGRLLNYYPPSSIKANAALEIKVKDRAVASFVINAMNLTPLGECPDPKSEQMYARLQIKGRGQSLVLFMSGGRAWNSRLTKCAEIDKGSLHALYPLEVTS